MNDPVRTARRRRRSAEAAAGAPKAGKPGPDESGAAASPEELAAISGRILLAFSLGGLAVWDWDVQGGKVQVFMPGPLAGGALPVTRVVRSEEWFDSTHPDDMLAAAAAVDRVLRGEAEEFSNLYRRRVGGEWVYVQSHGKVVEWEPDGRARRLVGLARNITGPMTEEKGRQAREAALRHGQLRATLTEFASGLAHELNQPLAALSLNVQTALRLLAVGGTVPPEAHEALQKSVSLAERAADIVRGMRQLVRRDGGNDESFDLRALAREVCEHLGPEARRVDVAVEADRRRRPVMVTADRVQIEQVLVNLVRNGVEALADGCPARRLVSVKVEPGPRSARVEVRDSGPGVSPEVRRRLFEPYVTTKAAGTGLGLRLCLSIAEAHGGRLVCAEDAPGRGALFILELPSVAGLAPKAVALERRRAATRRRAPRG